MVANRKRVEPKQEEASMCPVTTEPKKKKLLMERWNQTEGESAGVLWETVPSSACVTWSHQDLDHELL